jgi:hypothetical protein
MKASICYRNSFVFMPITFSYHQLLRFLTFGYPRVSSYDTATDTSNETSPASLVDRGGREGQHSRGVPGASHYPAGD